MLSKTGVYTGKIDAAVTDILRRCWICKRRRPASISGRTHPLDDHGFCQKLLAQQNVIVLPGSYLSRDTDGRNPGRNYVRMALVAPLEDCLEAAERIKSYIVSR